MGSNMAENHPVGFQWVMEAKERGAKVIHVDPRFTRTSAMADRSHAASAPAATSPSSAAMINYVLENDRWFDEYVRHYTNAPVIVDEDFRDTEDLDGLFSGLDPESGRYDAERRGSTRACEAGAAAGQPRLIGEQAHGAHGGAARARRPARARTTTLQHPRCVFQILKRHFARYTPELVEEICGVSREGFLEVAEALCANSGRERTRPLCYAVGWTQHTVGVQIHPRRPRSSSCCSATSAGPAAASWPCAATRRSRARPTSRRSTTSCPGYLPMPQAAPGHDLAEYVERNEPPDRLLGHMRATTSTSLLKAWWGDAATAENDYCFDYLPRIDSDHSAY